MPPTFEAASTGWTRKVCGPVPTTSVTGELHVVNAAPSREHVKVASSSAAKLKIAPVASVTAAGPERIVAIGGVVSGGGPPPPPPHGGRTSTVGRPE